ncbi:hypothetical protein DIU31_032375 [Mucilaginibacter rubeus]|uniref:Uncharacterized protein n=1 Tax=Mucilaginibacter rubeus TaxID=2027860 RepID=A0AAE6JM15_9SPHI|nr:MULTISPECIES: hypothetical protein [Mucilaginibacter]QEM07973.1 hypothetical protein DIU31_032375 [Mucilaginibacter rubeus]QEM20424.1 hypothetical protein DIU38_031980 [Mucilaginibacter gossypii]QTE42853.1 hypothetical protein J3L19_28675 [Mucilaginibacter rubeus]QTE49454.1 hypothetical protein J3L21_28635 [Mucilaginibacter rubeus]QTE54550.1 hypothetical protein J3L23_20260 [Mucilaginibacter rubeus]
MRQFKAKFKYIFLPFVFIGLCTIIIYTFLHWLLLIRFNVFTLKDKDADFLIPGIVGLVLPQLLLFPKLRQLKAYKATSRDPITILLMVGGFTFAVPICIAQNYLESATGKLTRLDSISEVHYVPATKYYTVKQKYPNKHMAHFKVIFSVSGKNNVDFNMDAYAAVPVFDHVFPDTSKIAVMRNRVNPKTLVIINDTLRNMLFLKKLPADSIMMMRYVNPTMVMPKYGEAGKYGALAVVTRSYKFKIKPIIPKIEPAAWFVFKYHKTISNSLSTSEKNFYFSQFAKDCDTAFKYKPLNKFIYLARLPNDDEVANYEAAINSRDDVAEGEQTMLSPVYESFEKRNGNKLAWIGGSFTIGATLFLLLLGLFRIKGLDNFEKRMFEKWEKDVINRR